MFTSSPQYTFTLFSLICILNIKQPRKYKNHSYLYYRLREPIFNKINFPFHIYIKVRSQFYSFLLLIPLNYSPTYMEKASTKNTFSSILLAKPICFAYFLRNYPYLLENAATSCGITSQNFIKFLHPSHIQSISTELSE